MLVNPIFKNGELVDYYNSSQHNAKTLLERRKIIRTVDTTPAGNIVVLLSGLQYPVSVKFVRHLIDIKA